MTGHWKATRRILRYSRNLPIRSGHKVARLKNQRKTSDKPTENKRKPTKLNETRRKPKIARDPRSLLCDLICVLRLYWKLLSNIFSWVSGDDARVLSKSRALEIKRGVVQGLLLVNTRNLPRIHQVAFQWPDEGQVRKCKKIHWDRTTPEGTKGHTSLKKKQKYPHET